MMLLSVAGYGQINPTTHLKPAPANGYTLISSGTYDRYFPRILFDYLRDTLAMDTSLTNELQDLTLDSNATTFTLGITAGNTVKLSKGGGAGASPGGADKSIQYNEGGSTFGGESALSWDYTNNRLGVGTATPSYIMDINNNALNTLAVRSAGSQVQRIRMENSTNNAVLEWDGQDLDFHNNNGTGYFSFIHNGSTNFYSTPSQLVLIGDLNLSLLSDINDRNSSTGTPGYKLTPHASGGVQWVADPGGTPGGSNTHVQYNASGAFGGESTFTYNSTSNQLDIANLYVTTGLRDGANSLGTNRELLTTTGTGSRWKTVSMTASLGLLNWQLDGVTAATVDLSLAKLSDAGKIFNNAASQNFYQVSPTKITAWGTTPSFSGTGIVWSSANDRWTSTYSGKYRVKCMINIDGTVEATPTPIRFEIRINGSKSGIYYHYFAHNDRNITCSIDEVFSLNASDYVEIFVQRGDSGTGKTVTMSATNESYFTLERINY